MGIKNEFFIINCLYSNYLKRNSKILNSINGTDKIDGRIDQREYVHSILSKILYIRYVIYGCYFMSKYKVRDFNWIFLSK